MRALAFIDSSIIVQGFKGEKKALKILKELCDFIHKIKLSINIIVFSETIYQLTYKRKFTLEEVILFLDKFKFFPTNEEVKNKALRYMEVYKLRPNDAIILATCKYYGIKYLISIDKDFPEPCKKEGIVLINSAEKLKEILEKENL
jgi:predicted nucleic acid-binding protein